MSNCYQCNEAVYSDDNFVLRACNHRFCHKCLCKYMKLNIDCKIKCPAKDCNKNISDQIIRKCLPNFEIECYEQISLCKSTKHARKCLTLSCPAITVIEDDNSIFQCEYCDQPNCLKCQKRHYPNQCGKRNQNEDAINIAANVAMSQHRRKALEEQFKNDDYIPNPESFECRTCDSFFLPREGIILRSCFHCCCKSCFENTLKSIDFIPNFKCPECNIEVSSQDVTKAIGLDKLIRMSIRVVAPKMFCCKYPDCDGMWDNKEMCKGLYICPICKHSNCLDCEDFHEGESCNEFRETRRYIDAQEAKRKLKASSGVHCKCGRFLIKKGGCGALHCDNCGREICYFTGKIAVKDDPDYCGCSSLKTCHPDCKYGCLPDSIPTPIKNRNQ